MESSKLTNEIMADSFHAGLVSSNDWPLAMTDEGWDGTSLANDCLLMHLGCSRFRALANFSTGGGGYVGTKYGRTFGCSGNGVTMRVLRNSTAAGIQRGIVVWDAVNIQSFRQKSVLQMCLTQGPARGAHWSPHCEPPHHCAPGCGYDARCRPWYSAHAAVAGPPVPLLSPPFIHRGNLQPTATVSLGIWNTTDPHEPRELVAVAAVDFGFDKIDRFLRALPLPNTTRVALVLNDEAFTMMGTRTWDSTRAVDGRPATMPLAASPDPPLRSLAGWMAEHRDELRKHTSVALGPMLWDVFRSDFNADSAVFVVVGMPYEDIFGELDELEAQALSALRAAHRSADRRIAESRSTMATHIAAVTQELKRQLEAVQHHIAQDLAGLRADIQRSIEGSQENATQRLNEVLVQTQTDIHSLEQANKDRLQGSALHTAGILLAILVALLAGGAYGAYRVTLSLVRLIAQVKQCCARCIEGAYA